MFHRTLLTTVAVVALSATAFASDLPNQKGPPTFVPPPPLFTWTGLYVGGQIGYQWGKSSTTAFPTVFPIGLPGYSPNGVTGGGHLGYNYQMGQFVVGLEGDANGSSYYGSNTILAGLFTYATHEVVNGSIRARAGVAWDRALVYATGGAAVGAFSNSYSALFGAFHSTVSTTRIGWTVGGGVDYALDNNWSVRAEYRYTDYGHFNESPFGIANLMQKHETDNKVQLGISYKFDLMGPAPIVAKY